MRQPRPFLGQPTAGLILITGLSFPAAAAAQSAAVPGVGAESFAQGLVGLAVVVALILAAAWVLRRMNLAGAPAEAAGMKIIAGLSVGPRERILLLEIGDSWVVVGVTATQMRTLHTLPKGKLPTADGSQVPNPAAFGKLLDQFRRRHDR